jgi:hypothetical protein
MREWFLGIGILGTVLGSGSAIYVVIRSIIDLLSSDWGYVTGPTGNATFSLNSVIINGLNGTSSLAMSETAW